jgi:hypothetical protein
MLCGWTARYAVLSGHNARWSLRNRKPLLVVSQLKNDRWPLPAFQQMKQIDIMNWRIGYFLKFEFSLRSLHPEGTRIRA